MSKYRKPTDSIHEIKLESFLTHAYWDKKIASVGARVQPIVLTQFVGNGAKIYFTLADLEEEDKNNQFYPYKKAS